MYIIYIFSSYLAFNPKSMLKLLNLGTVFKGRWCYLILYFLAFDCKCGNVGTKLPRQTRFEIPGPNSCTAHNKTPVRLSKQIIC